MERPIAEVEKAQPRPLSPIPEVGTSSKALTPKRPRSLTPIGVNRASGSKRP
jgi:hypothetical protein